MSDTFGALPLPVPVPTQRDDLPTPILVNDTSLGDPGLDTLLSFIQAVLNSLANTAWGTRAKGGNIEQVARFVSTNNPLEGEFVDNRLPGLFLYRTKGESYQRYAADLPSTTETLTLLWVFPGSTQWKERLRTNIINALSKILVLALEQGVHPAWVVPADLAQPEAIRTNHLTVTSPVIYSGADLDGLIGGGTVDRARPVTVRSLRGNATYNTTDPIVVTGSLASGQTGWTDTLRLTLIDGDETLQTGWNFASVESLSVPGQLNNFGGLAFGYAASADAIYGSPIRRHAGLEQLRCEVGKPKTIVIPTGKETRATYYGVEFLIHIQEMFRLDMGNVAQWGLGGGPPDDGVGMYTEFSFNDGTVYSEANFSAEEEDD